MAEVESVEGQRFRKSATRKNPFQEGHNLKDNIKALRDGSFIKRILYPLVTLEFHAQNLFTHLGAKCAEYPWANLGVVVSLFLCFMIGLTEITFETDVHSQWIDDGTRLTNEMKFLEDEYVTSKGLAVVLTTKEGGSLLTKEAWTELHYIVNKTFNVTIEKDGEVYDLEKFCYLAKGYDEDAFQPCLLVNPLDCFQEGRQAIPGLYNNSVHWLGYENDISFRADNWNFQDNFSKAYIEEKCTFWFGDVISSSSLFGGISYDDQGMVSNLESMKLIFVHYNSKELGNRGFNFISWDPTEENIQADMLGCPKLDTSVCTAEPACFENFPVDQAFSYGCKKTDESLKGTQCCNEFVEPMYNAACFEQYFLWNTADRDKLVGILGSCELEITFDYSSLPEACAIVTEEESSSTCAADYSTWSATCAAAQADPSNQQTGMDCCTQAKEYAEKGCNCDDSCDSGCSGMLGLVKSTCDAVNISSLQFEVTTCFECEASYSTWSATCAAAQADQSNLQAGMDCCTQAKEYAEKGCNCDDSCDSDCSGMLGLVKSNCDEAPDPSLQFEVTTCNECEASYSNWSATCAAAQADQSNEQAGMDCCTQAKEYAEKGCNCDDSCDSDCSGMLGLVKSTCDAVNISSLQFEVTTCNECEASYSTWSATCTAAEADPTNETLETACCEEAAVYVEQRCNCEDSCDSQCNIMLGNISGTCAAVGSGFKMAVCDERCQAYEAQMDDCEVVAQYAAEGCACLDTCNANCTKSFDEKVKNCKASGTSFQAIECGWGQELDVIISSLCNEDSAELDLEKCCTAAAAFDGMNNYDSRGICSDYCETFPDETCQASINLIDAKCAAWGKGFSSNTCASNIRDDCFELNVNLQDTCARAEEDLNSTTANAMLNKNLCCTLTNKFLSLKCTCLSDLCDDECQAKFTEGVEKCNEAGLLAQSISGEFDYDTYVPCDGVSVGKPASCVAECGEGAIGDDNLCKEKCDQGGCFFFYSHKNSTATAEAQCFEDQEFTVGQTRIVEMSEDKARDILRDFQEEWLNMMADVDEDFKHLAVAYAADRSGEDIIQAAASQQVLLIIGSYVLMLVYMLFFFVLDLSELHLLKLKANPTVPKSTAVLCALVMLLLSTFGSLGLSSLLSANGVRWSAITLQVLPLLSLGLGVNDFFVVTTVFKGVVAEHSNGTPQEVLAKTMSIAGVSMTLTSISRTCAFFFAAITPIPTVSDFAIQMGICMVCNYLLAVVAFPCILALDMKHSASGIRDPLHCCCKDPPRAHVSRRSSQFFLSSKAASMFSKFYLSDHRMVFKIVSLVLYTGFLILCIIGMTKLEDGLPTQDTIPRGTYLHDYVVWDSEYYSSFSVMLVNRYLDFPNEMDGIFALEYAFISEGKYMQYTPNSDTKDVSGPLRYFEEFERAKYCSGGLKDSDVMWVYDELNAKDICSYYKDMTCADVCQQANAGCGWCEEEEIVFPREDPNGPYKCTLNDAQSECRCYYRPFMKGDAFYDEFNLFLKVDGNFGAISKENSAINDEGKLYSTIATTYTQNLTDLSRKLDHMRKGREITDSASTGRKENGEHLTFPIDYQVYAPNEQYLHLEDVLSEVLCLTVFVVMIVMMPLMMHPLTHLICIIFTGLSLLEVYGLLYWVGLHSNSIVMLNMVIMVGVAVEFSVHICRAFMLATGTRDERISQAMDEVGIPTMNGGISTMLAVVFIAASSFQYFVDYFCTMWVIIVIVCWVNGMVILPVILSLVGPMPLLPEEVVQQVRERRSTVGDFSGDYVPTGPESPDAASPGSERTHSNPLLKTLDVEKGKAGVSVIRENPGY